MCLKIPEGICVPVCNHSNTTSPCRRVRLLDGLLIQLLVLLVLTFSSPEHSFVLGPTVCVSVLSIEERSSALC